jgi:hypothetical protein
MKDYAYAWDNLTPEERLALLRVAECPSSALAYYSVTPWSILARGMRVKIARAMDMVADT